MSAESSPVCRTYEVIRLACLAMVAITVLACAMAIKGWQLASLLLVGVIALLGTLLVIRISKVLAELRTHTEQVSETAAKAEEHYVGVLRRIVKFVEARDKYTSGRSGRIGKLTEMICRKMNYTEQQCQLMNLAGEIHDIGMLAVSEKILAKRSTLGTDEFRTIKKHSEVSYELLKPLQMLEPVLPAIRCHHERMNGTGYPTSLAGADIPTEARILAVADAYDAMTHDRPHRPAMSPLEAMKELRRCTPAGYDKACVDALAEIVNLSDLQAACSEIAPAPEASLAVAHV